VNTTALLFSLLISIYHVHCLGLGIQIYVYLQVVGHIIDVLICYEYCWFVYELCISGLLDISA
jgi:hypothetical protein